MKNITFFLILCGFHVISYSQSFEETQYSIDTLRLECLKKGKSDGSELKELLDKDDQLIGYTKYYLYLAYRQMLLKNEDSIRYYNNKALESYYGKEFETALGERYAYKAYYIKGLKEFQDEKYLNSESTLLKALELSENYKEGGFEDWRFYILDRLHIIHRKFLGDYEEAIKYLKQVAADEYHMELAYEAGNTFRSIAILYKYNRQLDSSKFYYKKAIDAYRNKQMRDNYDMESYYDYLFRTYVGLVNLYKQEVKIDSAVYYTNIKQKLIDKIDETKFEYRAYVKEHYQNGKAFLSLVKNRPNEAIKILNSNLKNLSKNDFEDREFKELKEEVYDLLAEAYEKAGFYKKAIDIGREKTAFIQSYNETLTKMFNENRRKYREQLSITENDIVNKENQIQLTELKASNQEKLLRSRNAYIFVLLILLLLIIGMGTLIFRQRKLRNDYNEISLKQRLLLTQMNPHFVFNALSTTTSLVNEKSSNTLNYIDKLSKLFRLILNSSREEFISLDDEMSMVRSYLDLESNFASAFNYSIEIDDAINKDEIFIPPMFMQPIVENAIKHGIKNKAHGKISISIKLLHDQGLLECVITDNGDGLRFKREQTYPSVSGEVLQERLKIYNKKFRVKGSCVTTEEDNKTIVRLQIPFVID